MILEKKNLILNKKRGLIDKALFLNIEKMKNEILDKNYYLSINFINKNEALLLNKKYRNKDYIPNILSFPLFQDSGEIFISLFVVRKEAKKFGMTYKNFLIFIIIHGLLHLKGLDHSKKMEDLEKKYLKKYAKIK